MQATGDLKRLLEEARACRVCAGELPLGPRPILQAHPDARILIASQAPGRIAHTSGIPFQDPSGRRLRAWMGVNEATFYDPRLIAIVPMGFCYPGRGKGGDLPPRPECAPLWREAVLNHLGSLRLTLVIGSHAQRWHRVSSAGSVAGAARRWLDEQSQLMPLPHPSPRNNGWLARHPWFERDLLPVARERVASALDQPADERVTV